MAIEIRRATVADVDDIMQLENSSFGSDAWLPETMRSELGSKHTYYLVAHDPSAPDELAGYAGLLAPDKSGDADIQTISVAVPFRRRGLGRQLMLALLGEARSRGASFVFLEVRADNPHARALYESLGFEQIAVRVGYYQPDDVDAQVMRVTLRSAEAIA
jgi:[ribosomal protein S18]-alanine N-acetyltransferase